MKVAIVAVGKLKQAGLRDAMDDYLRRIERYASCRELELKDGPAAELERRFRKAIPAGARVVALEVGGRAWDSPELAGYVAGVQEQTGSLAVLVGGADGLPPGLSAAADQRWSLSRLTLPHRLARVVVAEQIYRAFTLLRNEPYSH